MTPPTLIIDTMGKENFTFPYLHAKNYIRFFVGKLEMIGKESPGHSTSLS